MLHLNIRFLFVSILFMGCTNEKVISINLSYVPDQIELFGEGLISTDLYERDIAISSMGDEIIYTLGNHKQTIRSLIIIKKNEGEWREKQILPFSGRYQDIEPFFSVKGNRLFFASNRPMNSDSTRTDYNIWVSEKRNDVWESPRPLDTLINTTKDEFYPSVSENGNLYYTATKENGVGREDIFVSRFTNGKYLKPIPLDTTINTSAYEFNAFISPNEDLLIFSSFGRKDGLGGGDLYFSKKDNTGNWVEAQNMGATINSDKLDYCPFIDFSNGNFYFTSDRSTLLDKKIMNVSELEGVAHTTLNGMGNIYRIGMEQLNLQ